MMDIKSDCKQHKQININATRFNLNDNFSDRHIGINYDEELQLLQQLGVNSLEELIAQIIPQNIYNNKELNLAEGISEYQATTILQEITKKNKLFKSFIGMGYYGTKCLPVVVRNLLENPAWYTAYTPYQTEISQGRLEMLLNFQQMIVDLTGLPIANASLLDEATAAAEAMTLCCRASKNKTKQPVFLVDETVHEYTIDVLKTRSKYLDINVKVANITEVDINDNIIGILLQYPNTYGDISNLKHIIAEAKTKNVLIAMATDLLALTLLQSPGSLQADIAFGNSQRFGVPMGYGGPHAAFFAVAKKYQRLVPGRIVGVSTDRRNKKAYRLALQTREQHIRREKATSNICTSQALLANMATCYAIYHGSQGLTAIAQRINTLTKILCVVLSEYYITTNTSFFDTLVIEVEDKQQEVYQRALAKKYNLRLIQQDKIAVSIDELTTVTDIVNLISIIVNIDDFEVKKIYQIEALLEKHFPHIGIQQQQLRQDAILTHPVFSKYHTETELLRYLKHLEAKDYSLVHGMIPLGSCTMKLNATSQLQPLSWQHLANMHPFVPQDQAQGYLQLITELENHLKAITGFDAISMQPNSGAQGEFTGLITIRDFHIANNNPQRDICLIPQSAHGTNPASAAMVGMKIIIVKCDQQGNIDVNDLTAKAIQHQNNLAALMVTYPSTHGVFEDKIKHICEVVHQHGGQVYLDGANMNAQVGITNPAIIGADVCHLNLHKTFAIPHGGGGPGMGPIGVKSHLQPYLPTHCVVSDAETKNSVASAPFSSASLLAISWMYITTLGRTGLRRATQVAILNANYIASKLSEYYSLLYTGKNNKVAHECIIDIRPIKKATGISEEDIAKRLMDYSFHAPTMSFPVPGTLMIEPTESESLAELDRFINAMIAIKQEIIQVETGVWSKDNNPLVNAPHSIADLADETWNYPYTKQQAVFPLAYLQQNKFWPSVNRVDNAKGDRNLICTCPDINEYS